MSNTGTTMYADGILRALEKLGAPEYTRKELAALMLAVDAAHVAAYGYGAEWQLWRTDHSWDVHATFNGTDVAFSRRV